MKNILKTFRLFTFLISYLFSFQLFAQTITGRVTDEKGKNLGYASLYLKGGTQGTTTNSEGRYSLDLKQGQFTLVCAFVGYQRVEKKITVSTEGQQEVNFQLQIQQIELKEVVVKAGAEDPAYAIIRQAIATRKQHLTEVGEYRSLVYMKGMIRTTKVPSSIMGVKIKPNRDIIDSSGKGILYFSESLTNYAKKNAGAFKEEVISAKMSGNSQGFGFNSPNDLDVTLYNDNVSIQGINSRGFVSPIADNALQFYRYRFLGTFYEDGVEVNKIKFFPKRKFEPVFSEGIINIIENSWYIHSADVTINKSSQIEIADTLHVIQQMLPVQNRVWMPQSTHVVANFGVLGFGAVADFIAVFSDYNFTPQPTSFWKGNIFKVIDTAANKKTMTFWDSLRPMPLSAIEKADYIKKDALEQKFKDPHYLDSLDKISNRFKPVGFLATGQSFINRKNKTSITIPGLLAGVQYNTVEGLALAFEPSIYKFSDTGSFSIAPRIRYGFGNGHLNASVAITKRIGKDYRKRWNVGIEGGKYVQQINPSAPIRPLNNSLGTLLYTVNYLKLYEKAYGQIAARRELGNGWVLGIRLAFEDRFPLNNSDTSYKWKQYKDRSFTSNYPSELPLGYFNRHQAAITAFTLRFQPGQKYVQYPNRLVSEGSDQPVFSLQITKAWAGILGSDADFGKWLFRVNDEMNMRLGGTLKFDISAGGFINNKNVQLPDWQHFNGNQTIVASPFVRSFQLAPYYANSTKDRFFSTAHVEWHLNGLLTNKIPLLRKANWGLVTGANGFFVDANRHYLEGFVGMENIFKTLRIDFVWGYDALSGKWKNGFVLGFSGLFTGEGVD